MDSETRRATVSRVTKSQTLLKQLSTHAHPLKIQVKIFSRKHWKTESSIILEGLYTGTKLDSLHHEYKGGSK